MMDFSSGHDAGEAACVERRKATVVVEYYRGDAPVSERPVLVRVTGMDDIVLRTDTSGRASCTVPFRDNSYVVARSGVFVDKKYLREETFFRFVEAAPVEISVGIHGNPMKEGTVDGYTVVILNLGGIQMQYAVKALKRKGFSVVLLDGPFDVGLTSELERHLKKEKTQLWLIADRNGKLDDACFPMIYRFFEEGGGLYLLSDNDPYFVDTNRILEHLFRTRMSGDYFGKKMLPVQSSPHGPGIIKHHPIATGIWGLFEGITISHVEIGDGLTPLVFSSAREVVVAYYQENGKRALVDGGYTRLIHLLNGGGVLGWFYNMRSAGTARFFINCACWLAGFDE